MTAPVTDGVPVIAIYRRMQETLLDGEGHEATLLPAELLADDVVVETPFAPVGMRYYDGREAWLSYYRTAGAGLLVQFERFEELATYRTDDAEVLVVEYELTGKVIATGVRSTVRCIAVLRVHSGLITYWCEYQDIASITEALTRPAP